ncbi:hypothetical protein SAMN05216490_1533 [Mucilaginibacter mallensis]|uniref:DUF1735 domain-containing protein n=1 Tax=Mucilaginibacter mallensis TaxID=652787 RepID=A0A1H1TXR2_MUCMA|nr:hypothetical protein [Mucilaginibacter mallensis]SDS64419.1 hypothetical protein SAMN05216490_1533 [Mucilaginibacter mallensis]
MKKIYYLTAFVAMAFTACQKQPIVPLYPAVASVQAYNFTLASSDYALLPSSAYPSTTLSFKNATDAQTYIPTILNAKYPSKLAADNSTAAVTYTQAALSFKLTDSVYADVAYTLTPADYLLLPGNKYTDFSIAQVLKWLPYKYPSPVVNQLSLLTFTPYPATLTPPYSFLYLNGAWSEIYTITPAQYAVYGLGKYNQFTSTNDATLPAMLGALLKTDLTIQDTVKAGDIEYISFNYYGSDKGTYQRVIPLEYDGSNYVAPKTYVAGPLNFVKKSGQWQYVQPLPVIPYTLTAADIKLIAASTVAPSGQLSNLGSYGDFESAWTTAQLDAAMILVLTADFQTPQINTNYKVTYLAYVGGTDVPTSLLFQWSGTAWVAQQ